MRTVNRQRTGLYKSTGGQRQHSNGHCESSKPIAAHASASVVSSERPNRLAWRGLGLIDGGDSEENVNMLGRLAGALLAEKPGDAPARLTSRDSLRRTPYQLVDRY